MPTRQKAEKPRGSRKPKGNGRSLKVRHWPPQPVAVPVATFAPEPFAVLKEFCVVVQPAGAGFVATLFDANIGASGDTQEDAVQNLKDTLLNVFTVLEERQGQLGPEPKRQLAILRRLIRREA